jgi:TnpA family transposase
MECATPRSANTSSGSANIWATCSMAHSVEGITVDMLQYVSQMFLTGTTLKAANAILVDYHHRLALSCIYGTGIASSSDGQRFVLPNGTYFLNQAVGDPK